MQIRRMAPEDIQQVVEIADTSPEAASWTALTYSVLIGSPEQGEAWVADEQGTIAGFASFRVVDTEAELLNIAVHPQQRRKGCGSLLIEHILNEAARLGVERVFLEVRVSNQAALLLYERFGFRQIGRRRGYYPAPSSHLRAHPRPHTREDALLLAKDLPQMPPPPPQDLENR